MSKNIRKTKQRSSGKSSLQNVLTQEDARKAVWDYLVLCGRPVKRSFTIEALSSTRPRTFDRKTIEVALENGRNKQWKFVAVFASAGEDVEMDFENVDPLVVLINQ
jgi:hypothetical protein